MEHLSYISVIVVLSLIRLFNSIQFNSIQLAIQFKSQPKKTHKKNGSFNNNFEKKLNIKTKIKMQMHCHRHRLIDFENKQKVNQKQKSKQKRKFKTN